MAKQQQQQQSISSSTTTNDELCNWELVNQSDCSDCFSDFDSNFDVQSFDDLLLDDVVVDDSSSTHRNDVVDDDVVVVGEKEAKNDSCIVADDNAVNHVDLSNYGVNYQGHYGNFGAIDVDLSSYNFKYQGYYGNSGVHDEDDVHDDDGMDDDDDVDDDLVPWEMKGIYMKQRMKKSEKKYITNMCKSRKVFKTVRARYAKAY